MSLTPDAIPVRRDTPKQKLAFAKVRNAEYSYARALRQIAGNVNTIVRGFDPEDPKDWTELEYTLRDYARVIGPWARAAARRMILDVARRDEAAWTRHSRLMSRNLRREILEAPTGELLRASLADSVALITSLPTKAAQRVHDLTLEAMVTGERANEVAKRILETVNITKARAVLIARTEVARTSSVLVQSRAQHIGSEGYIWRTVGDQQVRPDHRKLNGKFFKWDKPPIADTRSGVRAHAGQIYNCRCIPEPVLPETIE